MPSLRLKLIVATLALGTAGAYLASASSGWVYFVDVDHFVAGSAPAGARVRLHGVVAPGAAVQRAQWSARFVLAGAHERLPVEFSGTVPPLFADGRRVVVEGRMGPDGLFHADVLLTQCASKYEGNPHVQGEGR